MIPASKYINSEFANDFAARVPYWWGMAGSIGNPGHPIGAMALNRLRHDRRLPIGQGPHQERTIFQSNQGDFTVVLETIPGPYKVVSPESVMHDSLGARLALMGLTPPQQEIASRVVCGVSNKRIASELDLTEQTVKDRIHAIFRKLGIHHRAELAARVLPLALDNHC